MNKKTIQKILSIICTTFIVSSGLFAVAVNPESKSISQSSVKTMAINAAYSFMKWTSAKIENMHNVYDFNNQLVAYSVDVENVQSNQQGYFLISSSPNDEPIMEFSTDTYSPYDNIESSNDICIFSGTCGYYASSPSKSKVYNITNKAILTSEEIRLRKESDKNHDHTAFDIGKAQNNRKNLSLENTDGLNKTLSTDSSEQIVLNVPVYTQNDNSCSETAAAMALRYDYPSSVPSDKDTIVKKLKQTMAYDPYIGTYYYNIPNGIMSAMSSWGITMNAYCTGFGRYNATLSILQQQINSYRPLLLCDTETDTSITYNYHTLCVVGYWSNSDFIIVHDTWPGHNNVAVNYDSSQELGSIFCFTIIQ